MSYFETTKNVYKEAAESPNVVLCCTTTPVWQLPGLVVPIKMQQMNYGYGSTVHPRNLVNSPKMLYVGIGGGMELLQFTYFSRQKGGVIGVEICAIKDPMPEDGPCVFTGKTAIYFGSNEYFDDKKGHVLLPNQPLAVCDKTAGALTALKRDDIFVSASTYFYDGGGCC